MTKTTSFLPFSITSLAVSQNGQKFALGTTRRKILIWTQEGFQDSINRAGIASIYCTAISKDGSLIASGSESSIIKLCHLEDKALLSLKGNSGVILTVSFADDGVHLAAGRALWQVDGKPVRRRIFGANAHFTPGSQTLIGSMQDWEDGGKGILLQEYTLKGEIVRDYPGQSRPNLIAISPDGQLVAADNKDANIYLWDREGHILLEYRHPNPNHYNLAGLAFHPGEQYLAAGCWGQSFVHLWDFDGKSLGKLPGFKQNAHGNGLVFISKGQILAGTSKLGVRLWQVDSGRFIDLVSSMNGRWLVVSSEGDFDTDQEDKDFSETELPLPPLKHYHPGLLRDFLKTASHK